MASLPGRTVFAPLAADHAARFRHGGPAALLDEAETRQRGREAS